jgi:site-specific recombinase XerD
MLKYADALSRFKKHLEDIGRSKYTIISYSGDLNQLKDYLDKRDLELEDVELSVLRDYKEHMLENTEYSVRTVSRKINSIRLFFQFLDKQGITTNNIASDLKHPEFKISPPRVLKPTEYRAIRDASRSKTKWYSIVEVLLQTGIRVGELVRLLREDVKENDGQRYLYIRSYQSQPEREVPLNDRAYNAMQDWLEVRPSVEIDNVYVTRTGNPLIVRNLRTSLLRIFESAGVEDATVNDLRNTFIAYYVAKGVDLERVADLVGHKNLTTTRRYKGLLNLEEAEDKEGMLEL